MTKGSGVCAVARIVAMFAMGLLVQACGDDTRGPSGGRDGAVDTHDALSGQEVAAPVDLAIPVTDAPSAKDVVVPADVASVNSDAPAAQDLVAPVDLAIPVVDAPQGQDLVQPPDVPARVETAAPMDGTAASTEAGSAIDGRAGIATPADFVDQLRQIFCADIDRCCGANASVVKGAQGGCSAGDWAAVTTSLQSALDAGATWDGVIAASCIAGLTQKLGGACAGPPLGNRTVDEAIVNIRASSIAACKSFIDAGNEGIGAVCGSHLECAGGLQCVTDLAPSVCAPLRGNGEDCGGGVFCDFGGLFCDEANTGSCLAVTFNGASCASGSQCADGLCAGTPTVCSAACR
jgi:hypothetical protein